MAVFWLFILAHFIADYPLQPSWLVRNKTRLWGLLLHVTIHLATMVILMGGSRGTLIWPFLITITIIHFFIDVGKNLVWKWRPQWVTGPYLVDQFLHYLTIALVAIWINQSVASDQLPPGSPWVIFAIGFLIATYVWYITEFVTSPENTEYHREIVRTLWSRMTSRAIFIAILLAMFYWLLPNLDFPLGALLLFTASISYFQPYAADCYWRRALFTDLTVAFCSAVFILLAA